MTTGDPGQYLRFAEAWRLGRPDRPAQLKVLAR